MERRKRLSALSNPDMPHSILLQIGSNRFRTSGIKGVGDDRPLSQVGARRKRRPGQFGQDGMGSFPATPSTKRALCFPPSSLLASIEISIKLIVCLSVGDEYRTIYKTISLESTPSGDG